MRSIRDCVLSAVLLVFFFFKQKTAYEMRISDWSSDVCSSDLPVPLPLHFLRGEPGAVGRLVGFVRHHALGEKAGERFGKADLPHMLERPGPEAGVEQVPDRMFDAADMLADGQTFSAGFPVEAIGRASCWEGRG